MNALSNFGASPPALVTIAVPTFNRAGYLVECVESIRRQTYPHLEILVGDNASTDATPEVIRDLAAVEPRLRVMRHARNLGMVGNFNALLRAARGRYFLLVSDDDLLTPRAVEVLVSACQRPNVQFAYGRAVVIDGGGKVKGMSTAQGPEIERGTDFIHAHLRGERSVTLAAMMFPIGEPDEREYYDAEIGSVCDFLLRLTLATRGDVAAVREFVAHYRVHDASLTASAADFAASHCRMLTTLSVATGDLAPYREEVRAYVRDYLTHLASAAASRGNLGAAFETASVMEANGLGGDALRTRLRILALPPVRLAAEARRRIGAWRASRRA